MKAIRLALSILLGRKNTNWLTQEELLLIGYRPQTGYDPEPDREEILNMAEQVVLDTFEYLYSSANQAVIEHEESFHRD